MQIKFIGHATFELTEGDGEGDARVLVDPFLAPHNPAAGVSAEDVDPTHILITHGHTDHTADAVAVAKRTGAPVLAITELAGWFEEQGGHRSRLTVTNSSVRLLDAVAPEARTRHAHDGLADEVPDALRAAAAFRAALAACEGAAVPAR